MRGDDVRARWCFWASSRWLPSTPWGGVALADEGPAAQGDKGRDVEVMGSWPYEAPLVATGSSIADALSAGPCCRGSSAPVSPARGGALTEEAVEAVRFLAGVRRVVLLGGGVAVSPSLVEALTQAMS